MASMLTELKVKDFSAWKKIYDSNEEFRKSSGALSGKVFHDAADPNKVVILFNWDSLAGAKKFASSPQLKARQEQSGVLGEPTVRFLTEA